MDFRGQAEQAQQKMETEYKTRYLDKYNKRDVFEKKI